MHVPNVAPTCVLFASRVMTRSFALLDAVPSSWQRPVTSPNGGEMPSCDTPNRGAATSFSFCSPRNVTHLPRPVPPFPCPQHRGLLALRPPPRKPKLQAFSWLLTNLARASPVWRWPIPGAVTPAEASAHTNRHSPSCPPLGTMKTQRSKNVTSVRM